MAVTIDILDCKQNEIERRVDNLEREVKDIKELTLAINNVNNKVDNVSKDVKELKDAITSVKDRPSKLMDKLLFAIIGAIGAGVGAYIVSLFI